jgi:spore maturation protein CgeB
MFGDGIVIADSPDEFRDKIEYYKNAADERSVCAQRGQKLFSENHTGFHRVATIMKEFGYEDLSFGILKAYKDALNEQK